MGEQSLIFVETLLFLYLHQNDVVSDLADTLPGNDIFAFSSEKAAETAGAGNDKSSKTAGFAVEFHVDRAAEASTGTGIDDFFLL